MVRGDAGDQGGGRHAPGRLPFPQVGEAPAFDCIAASHGVSAAQVALAWLLARGHVTPVIVGARHQSQRDDNLAAASLTLRAHEMKELALVSALPIKHPG